MRAAVHAYIDKHPDIDPRDIHWVIPLALRRDEPAVRDMPGSSNDVIVMVRGILAGWFFHGPGGRRLPPQPPEARDPRST